MKSPTAIFTVPAANPWQIERVTFGHPQAVWMATRLGEVQAVLQRAEEAQQAGCFVCVVVTYEAAGAFDRAVATHLPGRLPLVWCAAFARDEEFVRSHGDYQIGSACPTTARSEYLGTVNKILAHIRAGDIYQANFTIRAECEFRGDALALFEELAEATRVPYACYVDTGDTQIVSLSPELFLERRGDVLVTKPMKGTAARRPAWEADEAARLALARSSKDRAELTMIVDLMRNDLGRICKTGTVRTEHEYLVTRHPTVHQMTTDVRGDLNDGIGLWEILRATFPPGSVTGAPKVRATEIIRDCETTPRGIYCGSVMLLKPGRDFVGNVAIRTLEIHGNIATVGVGSGIVADSDPEREWDETLLKARFTQLRAQRFGLYEAFRYVPGVGYQNLDMHLTRLSHSCAYFGRPFPEAAIRNKLSGLMTTLGDAPNRVRLDLDGEEIALSLLPEELGWPTGGVIAMIPDLQVDPDDARLYHKTTLRKEKTELRAKAKSLGAHECLFVNSRGEFTEGAISSYEFCVGGQWLTPELSCGLLPGVWRDRQIESGMAREGVVRFDEIYMIEAIRIGNSVRGAGEVVKIILEDGSEVYRAKAGGR